MHLVGLYTHCKMMHGAYNVKCDGSFVAESEILNSTAVNIKEHSPGM